MEAPFVTANHDRSYVSSHPTCFVIMTVKRFPSHNAFVDISDFIEKHRDQGFFFAVLCP